MLARKHGLRVLITAAGTRHGSLLSPTGMSPAEVLNAVGDAPAPPQAARPAPELLAAQRRERAGVRAEKGHRWGRPQPIAA